MKLPDGVLILRKIVNFVCTVQTLFLTLERFKNIHGFHSRFIYKDPEAYFVHKTSRRLPTDVRTILSEMNLFRLNDWRVMYNSAEVNADLWKVKAYVSIQPIRLPDGLPTKENMQNFRLLSNGKLIDKTKRYPKHMQVTRGSQLRFCL